MMASLKLTVAVPGKPSLHITIHGEQIVALGPSAGGGAVIRIPTREIVVAESVDTILQMWLGPGNGCPECAAPLAQAGD